jgi:polynucleotide 5'-hydroxyl-kinase GRC3/NOL9
MKKPFILNSADLLDARAIFEPESRGIMVIGASDTGKTTLIMTIAEILSRQYDTAIVDLDMGQSHLGPPTTVAWGKVDKAIKDWSMIEVMDFYFTGTVTPLGSLLPAITGAKIITEKAFSSADKVIIDTTGLISGPAGQVLKHFKIDVIRPDIIIAIESSGELSHILDPLRFNESPRIIKIPVPPEVRVKTQMKRAEYRFQKMMEHLRGAQVLRIPINEVGIRFMRTPLSSGEEITDRIVSLRDRNNEDIALGLLRGIRGGEVMIFTPLRDRGRVASIIIGKAIIDMKNRTLKDSS